MAVARTTLWKGEKSVFGQHVTITFAIFLYIIDRMCVCVCVCVYIYIYIYIYTQNALRLKVIPAQSNSRCNSELEMPRTCDRHPAVTEQKYDYLQYIYLLLFLSNSNKKCNWVAVFCKILRQ